MTTRHDLQYEQDWNLDGPGNSKAAYYAPIMCPPMDKVKLEASIQRYSERAWDAAVEMAEKWPHLYDMPTRPNPRNRLKAALAEPTSA